MAEAQASIKHKREESPDAQWQRDPSALNPQYTWRWQQLAADLHGGLLLHWQGKMPSDALILKTDLFEERIGAQPANSAPGASS